MVNARIPALALAPMDGITDAPMRALQGATGAFSYAVTEFLRVSNPAIPVKVFRREVPELENAAQTMDGMPVQVQLLGGDCELMAESAVNACKAGATAIDINFGCPAPTVNRHDGGASLLRHPCRIREIVRAVRTAVDPNVPVSAKLRLGWDNVEAIYENATMAAEGGASWLTIHARTKMQGYAPPVFWKPICKVRESLGLPVVANGDIWNFEDFERCRDETGCIHFMIGRSALANPGLPYQIADSLGLSTAAPLATDWSTLLQSLVFYTEWFKGAEVAKSPVRLKQWLKLASSFGDFADFDKVKYCQTAHEIIDSLAVSRGRAIA